MTQQDDESENVDQVPVALGPTPDGAAKRILKVLKINNKAGLRLKAFEIVDKDGEKTALLTFE